MNSHTSTTKLSCNINTSTAKLTHFKKYFLHLAFFWGFFSSLLPFPQTAFPLLTSVVPVCASCHKCCKDGRCPHAGSLQGPATQSLCPCPCSSPSPAKAAQNSAHAVLVVRRVLVFNLCTHLYSTLGSNESFFLSYCYYYYYYHHYCYYDLLFLTGSV